MVGADYNTEQQVAAPGIVNNKGQLGFFPLLIQPNTSDSYKNSLPKAATKTAENWFFRGFAGKSC